MRLCERLRHNPFPRRSLFRCLMFSVHQGGTVRNEPGVLEEGAGLVVYVMLYDTYILLTAKENRWASTGR